MRVSRRYGRGHADMAGTVGMGTSDVRGRAVQADVTIGGSVYRRYK